MDAFRCKQTKDLPRGLLTARTEVKLSIARALRPRFSKTPVNTRVQQKVTPSLVSASPFVRSRALSSAG